MHQYTRLSEKSVQLRQVALLKKRSPWDNGLESRPKILCYCSWGMEDCSVDHLGQKKKKVKMEWYFNATNFMETW